VRQPLSGKQQDAYVADGKEPEPEAVSHGGVRRLRDVGERKLPVDIPAGPQREGDSDNNPRHPFVSVKCAASEAQHR
jgi:hypothetical protein